MWELSSFELGSIMESTGNDRFIPRSSSTEISIEQEFIINKTLLTHEADGGRRVDCKILFQAMESVMFYASKNTDWMSANQAIDAHTLDSIENFDSKETLRHTILKMSRVILCECHNDTADIHTRTLVLLEMLGSYRWDAKVILILTAFSISYGEFRLILEVCSDNALAASLAALKNLCQRNLEGLRPQLKAMEMVVKEMVELAKCVVRFEGLPVYDDHDRTLMADAKSQVYLATYWIFRSTLTSASQITDLIAMKQENSSITANAAWGLSSLALRLRRSCSCLRMQIDATQDHIEQKVYKKLMDLVKDDTQVDNQEVLHLLFSLNDDFPLKDSSSSQAKVGISRLKHKIVMLLVSKPDLLPIDQTILLLHQTKEHPHNKNIEQDYEIVWVPSSETWTLDEHTGFDYLSNSLPWLSIRQPWLLNAAVVRMIREEWKFEEDPLMVVLDSIGVVSNYNAIDMVLIWGPKAFPFSSSREKELWELEEHWNLQLMFDGIDHFLMKTTVEASENICVCGSSNLDRMNEFESRIKKLQNLGLHLRVIYVGSRNASENTRTTLAVMNKDNALTPIKIRLFWLRLERIRDSILRVGQIQTFANYETLLKQVSELLETDDRNNDWVIFGCGSSKDFVKLEGNKIMDFFDRFPVWAERVARFGFVGAIRSVDDEVNLTEACDHRTVVPYDVGMVPGTVVCDKCKRTMKAYVGYQCEGSKLNASS